MKTYKNVDEFIKDVLPEEYDLIIKRKESEVAKFIEKAETDFSKKLEAIIKGESEKKKSG
jgi:hypothetical protein